MNPEQWPWECYAGNAKISRVALDGTAVIFTPKA